jgi:tRNA modification GTPase
MTLEVLELTPRGAGGVSVVRVRGAEAFDRVREIAPRARSISAVPQLLRLSAGGEELDEAIVCVLSPTEIEVHVHGSPPLVAKILDVLRGTDASVSTREASRGVDEPRGEERAIGTRERAGSRARSFEESARSLLEQAASESGARILLDQAEGALRHELRALAAAAPRERALAVRELLGRGRVARFAIDPVEVILAGATNAGKSTLFNLLLGEERAIVSDEEGTTRDVLRERAVIGAYPVFLTDTAGEGASSRTGESEELDRAIREHTLRAARGADLVLWLVRADSQEGEIRSSESLTRRLDLARSGDATAGPGPDATIEDRSPRSRRFEILHTQADRVDGSRRAQLRNALSASNDAQHARERIHEIFLAMFDLPAEPWSPGAGVPFDLDWMRAVAALPIAADRRAWSSAVEALLGAD